MKQEKSKRTLLWLVLVCVLAVLAGFQFRDRINLSKIFVYAPKSLLPLGNTSDIHPMPAATSKSQTVTPTKCKFTFLPNGSNRFAWSVTYPDGRTFKLGEEFSSDCPPIVGRAAAPATIRFEFNEQRSCNSSLRKTVQVDAASLKDVNADGSPDVIAAILTGGNVNGHATSLILLTSSGPQVVRRLD